MGKTLKSIHVTKTYLPPLEDYVKYLEKIWESGWITNNGQLVAELEKKLKQYLGVKNLFLINNGTLALQIAIKSLNLKEEIITTPFSYIATVSSILWENCKPVFVDIDPNTLFIDPHKIESAITERTQAILAVHVYGNPCEIEKIDTVARKYNLKVIYDAAHAFGVKYNGKSILSFGDVSVVSFHATKVFHTAEGGAIVAQDDDLAGKISNVRNFGHKGYDNGFFGIGINGKNSELHAAIGLSILPKVNKIMVKRKKSFEMYNTLLKDASIQRPKIYPNTVSNYGYYPVIFKSKTQLLRVRRHLNLHGIFPRRYFYPSLNTIPYVIRYSGEQSCPVSEDISRRVLCLPLHHDLLEKEIRKIAKLVGEQL